MEVRLFEPVPLVHSSPVAFSFYLFFFQAVDACGERCVECSADCPGLSLFG